MKREFNREIVGIMREEYESRLRYFLSEKISIKDKRGNNLIKYAKGLKVRDKAGFEYTFVDIVEKEGEEYIKLYLPQFGIDAKEIGNRTSSKLFEFDNFDNYEEQGFYSRGLGRERGINSTNDGDSIGFSDEVGIDSGVDKLDSYDNIGGGGINGVEDMGVVKKVKLKKEKVKYILVPLGEFEERFSV